MNHDSFYMQTTWFLLECDGVRDKNFKPNVAFLPLSFVITQVNMSKIEDN